MNTSQKRSLFEQYLLDEGLVFDLSMAESNGVTFYSDEQTGMFFDGFCAGIDAGIDSCSTDSKIAKVIRQKLTSGNSVPIERCTVFAREIELIEKKNE
jgi:hypothetical protein